MKSAINLYMGNFLNTNISSEQLHNEIKNVVKNLIYEYESWTNEETCQKLELLYHDKLLKFNKSSLLDISAIIGYKYNKKVDKGELCKIIIQHYKRRIDLLKAINNALERGRKRIYQAQNGPICKRVDSYIEMEDFFTCEQIPNALWIEQEQYKKILESYKRLNIYEGWKYWILELDKYYYKSLKKLLRIVRIIKQDIDNSLSDIEFEIIEIATYKIIENMNNLCDIYYILSVNYT